MISVKSYIKKIEKITSLENLENEFAKYFIIFNNVDCLDVINDFDYIEGAIVVNCYGNIILGFKQWDMIDQLWVYFISAIEELIENSKEVCFYFPDQPIKVKFQMVSREQVLLSVLDDKISVNKNELLSALLSEAKNFFEILKNCTDEYLVEQSKYELERIQRISIKLNNNICI